MKQFATLVALLLVTLSGYTSTAPAKRRSNLKVAIVQNANQTFKVVYLEKTAGKVNIDILNKQTDKVYSQEVINVDGFSKTYDFSQLPSGEYTFEVTSQGGNMSSHTLMFNTDEKKEINEINGNHLDALSVQ